MNILYKNNVGAIREYLEKHKDKINTRTKSCVTPLLFAVEKNRVNVIDLLIEHGCDINILDNTGRTFLHECSYSRHTSIDIINRLLDFMVPTKVTVVKRRYISQEP